MKTGRVRQISSNARFDLSRSRPIDLLLVTTSRREAERPNTHSISQGGFAGLQVALNKVEAFSALALRVLARKAKLACQRAYCAASIITKRPNTCELLKYSCKSSATASNDR